MKKILLSIYLSALVFLGQAQQTVELNNWKFATGDNFDYVKPGFDDSAWKPIKVGINWQSQEYPGYEGYAWYRIRFTLPSEIRKNVFFKDSIRFVLGKIDDMEQTFLNGEMIGQNGNSFPLGTEAIEKDLTKLNVAWDITRNYALSVNDPRLKWDQENVLAVRVFNYSSGGGIYSLPVQVRMTGLSDYVSFNVDSWNTMTLPNGIIQKIFSLKNNAPLAQLKGKLNVEFADAANGKTIASKNWDVVMGKNSEATFSMDFKGDILTPVIARYTFSEPQTGSKVISIRNPDCKGGWVKYENNPVLGGHIGTFADLCICKTNQGNYQMYCGSRETESIMISESANGLDWSVPVTCMGANPSSGWEDQVNRPVIVQKESIYHIWYTGQVWNSGYDGRSWIGHATSTDGRNWKRSARPVLSPDAPWEKRALMCPHVMWDEQAQLFKMWYSGGEMWEPDAIGYATSNDGIHWEKYKNNPVFSKDEQNSWEKLRVAGCQVIKRENDYLMFYIGYGTSYAQIGMARSKDGVTGWERYRENPLIMPGVGWDFEAVFKPYAVPEPDKNRWLLYFNAGSNFHEQIGIAIHKGMDLGF